MTDTALPAEPPHPYRWAMLTGVWLLYFSFGLAWAGLLALVLLLLWRRAATRITVQGG